MVHNSVAEQQTESVMREEERKDFWLVTVQQEVIQKVVFNEPLTLSEAIEAYNDGDYYDILDEEVVGCEDVVEIK